ncbi:MAG TPA: secretin N-terminal domain-containing protein [Verrucomicrobiae bacterium]|nr:secretin N-terminal domain-containing protein [Verrucomicrobiae bacterium]
MKSKQYILAVVGLATWSLAAMAQTNIPAGDVPVATNSVAPTAETTQPSAAQQPAGDTNAPVQVAQAAPAADTNAPVQVAQATPAADTNAPAQAAQATPAADPNAASGTDTNTPPGGVITLITMDDVPITDAIKNLARQAGLNYILDPRVSFGQIGPDGKPVPQPSVSIRWENVTAAQALTALLGTYNLQLVEDPKSKIARVTVRDPAAPDPLVTKVIQLKYASPSNLLAMVQNVFTDKRSKVVPDVRTSQLVVLATDKELSEVDELIARLDTQTKQVLIEGRLLETSFNPSTAKGIDWSGTLANQHVSFGNNAFARGSADSVGAPIENGAPVTSGLLPVPNNILNVPQVLMNLSAGSAFNPSMAFLNADGVSAVISFLNQNSETKVLSTPRTVTLDNEMATIEVGTMFPIVNVTAGTVQTAGGSMISYSNLTVRLKVTPRISANDYINLHVQPSVMRLGPLVKSTVGGLNNSVNSFLTRDIQTSVLIPSGDTLVMGGLISDEEDISNVKVPLLGDIPGIGLLFRQDIKSRNKNNLIVFLTPTIVKDSDFQPTRTDYLSTPVPSSDYLGPDWSAWDSGKPKDWSKPDQSATPGTTSTTQPDSAGRFAAIPDSNK